MAANSGSREFLDVLGTASGACEGTRPPSFPGLLLISFMNTRRVDI